MLALPAGSYTLTVSGSGATTGAYSFRLLDLSQAAALTPGTPVSGTLAPANSTNAYQFSASAGQSFYFAQLSASSGNAYWRLIDPYGNVLFGTPLSSDGGRLTLSATGNYTVLVEGYLGDTGTASYSFNAAPVTDTTQPLTLGSTVNSSLAAPGEQDRYTFNLASASLLYFDALTNNGNFAWSLSGPVGTAVSNRSFTNSDGFSSSPVDPVLALPAGSYTLTVSGSGQTTGRLLLPAAGPVAGGGADAGHAGQRHPGPRQQHQRLPVQRQRRRPVQLCPASTAAASLNADWRLIDPYGNVLFGTFLGFDPGTVTLTASGTYTLLVEGYIGDTGTGNYTLNVQFQGNTPPQAPSGTPLSLGSVVNGTLAVAGQQDRYTFTLASASLLYFDALTNNDNFAWSLSGPVAPVSGRSFTGSDGFRHLRRPGAGLAGGLLHADRLRVGRDHRGLLLPSAGPVAGGGADAGHAGQRHPGPRQQHQRLPVQRQRRPVLLLRPALGQQRQRLLAADRPLRQRAASAPPSAATAAG